MPIDKKRSGQHEDFRWKIVWETEAADKGSKVRVTFKTDTFFKAGDSFQLSWTGNA